MAQYIYTMNRVAKIVPPKRFIIKDISLSFFPGAKIGVLGLNGSGKSTLLRAIEDPSLLEADGFSVSSVQLDVNAEVGKVPQRGALFDHLSVEGNLRLALRHSSDGAAATRGAAADWLERFRLPRAWAERVQQAPVPLGNNLVLDAGGEGTAADLVSGVERGLLVTRFWYIRGVDPRSLSYTGLTRDGVFLIENGQITRPVSNLRFNESIIRMLGSIEAAGAPERVVASESGGLGSAIVAPPLVVRDFQFTAVSDAV